MRQINVKTVHLFLFWGDFPKGKPRNTTATELLLRISSLNTLRCSTPSVGLVFVCLFALVTHLQTLPHIHMRAAAPAISASAGAKCAEIESLDWK